MNVTIYQSLSDMCLDVSLSWQDLKVSVIAREEEGGRRDTMPHNADVIILTIIPGGSLARLALAPPLALP